MFNIFTYVFEVKKELLVCVSLSVLYLTYYLVEVVKVKSIILLCCDSIKTELAQNLTVFISSKLR